MPKWQWSIAALYALLSIAMLWRFQLYPSMVPNADALAYVSHGIFFRYGGLFRGLDNIRTYGYPLAIYFYTFIAGFDPRSIALVAGAAQLTLYGAAVLWLARLVAVESPAFARATLIGLLLNPILVGLVGDVLTEGPSLILAVLALVCLLQSVRARTVGHLLIWAALGAAASNFALMIRPGNLVLILAWNGALLLSLFLRKDVPRGHVALGYAVVWLATAAAAWTPQFLHTGAVLPMFPLFDGMVKWGIIWIKFGTSVNSAGEGHALIYPNPWCIMPGRAYPQSWRWFAEYPGHAVATMAAHLFSAFSFEQPSPMSMTAIRPIRSRWPARCGL
jgi:hypothetical protein